MVRRLCMCQLDLDAIPGTVLDVIQILDMLPPVHLLRCPRGGHAVECVLRPLRVPKEEGEGGVRPSLRLPEKQDGAIPFPADLKQLSPLRKSAGD